MGFVNEEDDVAGGLDFVHECLETVLELAANASPSLHSGNVEGAQTNAAQFLRHVTGSDPKGKALHDGGFANPRVTREDGVVLAAAHEDVNDLADFIVTTDDRINAALARFLSEILGELGKGFGTASGGRDCGSSSRLKRRLANGRKEVRGFGGPCGDLVELLCQFVGRQTGQQWRNAGEKIVGFSIMKCRQEEMTTADAFITTADTGMKPSFTDQGANRGRDHRGTFVTRRDASKGIGNFAFYSGLAGVEKRQDSVDVRVGEAQEMVEPMHQFNAILALCLAISYRFRQGLEGFLGKPGKQLVNESLFSHKQ
jgi:hypothetical protein